MDQGDLLDSFDIGKCGRCSELLRVAKDRNPEARMLRHAKTTEGLCVNCALREWFEVAGEVGAIRDLDPQHLLIPMIQQQMGRVFRAANADADPAEINWAKVVRDWNLPLSKAPGKKAKRARAARFMN